MVPGFSTPDPDILQPVPPRTVLAQILLHVGQLTPNLDPERVGSWAFPRTFSLPSFGGALTSEIFLDIPDLAKAELVATPFDGGAETRWCLESVAGENVVVTFANLCDQNPLRWDVINERIEPDDDFRWYYTLLSSSAQSNLLTQLGGLTFPIPLPSLTRRNGEGRNCFPITTSAVSYNQDSLLPGRSAVRGAVLTPEPAIPESLRLSNAEPLAINSGREYLMQMGVQALSGTSKVRAAAAVQPGDFQGELGFQVLDVRGTFTEVELTRLGLVSPGVATKNGASGQLSLSALSGRGHIVRSGEGKWSLQAQVKVQVLYREIEKRLPFQRLAAGLYQPDIETFAGVVQAELSDAGRGDEMTVTDGSIDLRWVSGGLNWIDRLKIPIQHLVLTGLSTAASPRAAGEALDSRDCPGIRRLRLQPYAFRNGDRRAHSGSSWKRQLKGAEDIWSKCCIQFDAEPLAFIERPDLQTSEDVNAIRGSVEESNSEPDLIEVFLVDNDLVADGGGASFSCTTGLARIVISNNNAGNPNLLAHELGHVFGGLHPHDPEQEGFWRAEEGTVLDPSGSSNQPNPANNPAANCRQIRNAALISTGEGCCISA